MEDVREDGLTRLLTVHVLLGLESPHVRCKVRQQVRLVLGAEAQVKQVLGPHQAVHRLLGGGANGAVGVDLLGWLGLALEALRLTLLDDRHLAEVPCAAGLKQGALGGEAEAVDVAPRVQVVQGVHHGIESADELHPVLGFLHVAVVGNDLHPRAELPHCLSCDLRLWPIHMIAPEQKLAVQV